MSKKTNSSTGGSRQKAMDAKRARKLAQMNNPAGSSRYARKVAFCIANGVNAGSVPEPKPWK
jgi:hypothetical protein